MPVTRHLTQTSLRTLLASVALLLAACAPRVGATPESSMPETTISLTRTTCLGSCPGYTVSVTRAGEVSFKGHAHVRTGDATAQATPDQVTRILAAVKQADLRSMRDSYASADDGCEVVMTDQPGIRISVVDAEGSKTVDYYYGCTGAVADAVKPRIEQLAREIDRELDTARWIGKPAQHGVPPDAVDR